MVFNIAFIRMHSNVGDEPLEFIVVHTKSFRPRTRHWSTAQVRTACKHEVYHPGTFETSIWPTAWVHGQLCIYANNGLLHFQTPIVAHLQRGQMLQSALIILPTRC